jgi:hypothetical protein
LQNDFETLNINSTGLEETIYSLKIDLSVKGVQRRRLQDDPNAQFSDIQVCSFFFVTLGPRVAATQIWVEPTTSRRVGSRGK